MATNPFESLMSGKRANNTEQEMQNGVDVAAESCGDEEIQLEGILRVSVDKQKYKCVFLQGEHFAFGRGKFSRAKRTKTFLTLVLPVVCLPVCHHL